VNIFSVAHAAVSAVNPLVPISIRVSTGYTTTPDGSRTPAYAPAVIAKGRLQALQYNDLQLADSLNIQGVRSKLYIFGQVDGLVRAQNKGGDLVTLSDGSIWKVAVVAENWPAWCSAIITLQNGA
jgi:hypothetical protein